MQFQRICKTSIKFILSAGLVFPFVASAHLIVITPTTPFPATVAANSITTATFTVTNITAQTPVTVIDQSKFPLDSGLSISSSTCGSLLAPKQSCTINVSLTAPAAGHRISAELREWAKPSADGVQYPINITVTQGLPNFTLVPVTSSSLPALREPIVATNGDNWLIVSGSTGNFHDFNNNFNTSLYVYNPKTAQINSVLISSTDLTSTVINQLATTAPEFLQDGDTLYIIGGYFNDPITPTIYTTLNTITAIDVPGMTNAIIIGQTALAQYVSTNTNADFKVTGGQLGKIGSNFYLAFGQACEGDYCAISQVYTNSVYEFSTDPLLTNITILNTVTHNDLDNSGWRRRDYSLAPFILNGVETLFAMGGPFTQSPSNAVVWTNGITFNANIQSNDNFINQQANQYLAPRVSMYSANSGTSYVATFSGLSNLYWTTSGLVQNGGTPYGNILDLISADASGNVQEYANIQPLCSGQPLANCLYMGLGAEFVPVDDYYDGRKILQLDQLSRNTPTLVGYIYAGLLSLNQDIFGTNASYPTNQVYAVYAVPEGAGANWKNITNLYPGN